MHIGNKAHFEQDNTYHDMDGNLKTFTHRDYSKKIKIGMAPTPTEESRKEANSKYQDSIEELVKDLCSSYPPLFASEHDVAVHKYGHISEWNKEALEIMFKDPNAYTADSDLSKLKKILINKTLEYLGYSNLPNNFNSLIEAFEIDYKEGLHFIR